MTVRLYDLVQPVDLAATIGSGQVVRRDHPDGRVAVLGPARPAGAPDLWQDDWTAVRRLCNGLVHDRVTGQVLARAWPVFHDHDHPAAATIPADDQVEVTDKVDGALGVLFPAAQGRWEVAGRASFTTWQSLWAAEHYAARYARAWVPTPGWTYLVEIVHPMNRTVVGAGTMEGLVLLGAVEIATGRPVGPHDGVCRGWPGPRVRVLGQLTMAEALAAPPRPQAEGVVVRSLRTGRMVTVRYPAYRDRRRLLSGLDAGLVWELLGAGDTVDGICAHLPPQYGDFVREVAAGLLGRLDGILEEVRAEFAALHTGSRREFAVRVRDSPRRSLLLMVHDGRDPVPAIWQDLRPPPGPALPWPDPWEQGREQQ